LGTVLDNMKQLHNRQGINSEIDSIVANAPRSHFNRSGKVKK
jgi:hypothetical protein